MGMIINSFSVASAVPFSPLDISGLQLWLKADSLALANNDPVSSWTDLSGNANHPTQTFSRRPTYKTNVINGLSVVRFDGSLTHDLEMSDIILSGAYTVYAVGAAAPSSLWIPCGGQSASAFVGLYSNGNTYVVDDGNSAVNTAQSISGNIVVRWHRAAVGSANFVKGTGLAETSMGINGTLTLSNIGARDSSANYTTGDFGEILVWNVDLTAPQQAQVDAYLAARWGVSF